MKVGNHLISVALSILPLTAALATQPAPTQGLKAATDAHGSHQGPKSGVNAEKQKKTETSRTTSQTWRRIEAVHGKENVDGPRGKDPEAGPGGAKNDAATGMMTKSVRPHGVSPVPGTLTTRNAASISGTGLHPRGTTPAVIHPAAKYGARISGTGIAGEN